MAFFHTKNTNLGKFCRALQWKMLIYFYGLLVYVTTIWYILWPFGIPILWYFGIFSGQLVYFVAIWYVFFPLWYVVPRKIWQPIAVGANEEQSCIFFAGKRVVEHPKDI
jgi:hypothetical protein